MCAKCGDNKPGGARVVFARDELNPEEYERIVWGVAKQPTREQRTIRINGVSVKPPDDDPWWGEYTCDQCSAGIKPGARACAQTIWLESGPEPPLWESEYVAPPEPDGPQCAEEWERTG